MENNFRNQNKKSGKNCIIRASENLEIFSDQLLLKIIFKSKIFTMEEK